MTNESKSSSDAPHVSGQPFSFTVQTDEYRSQPIPGIDETAKLGHCFVRVTDLPARLEEFMEVNPRVPSRTQKGVLSGPVVKGITNTLKDSPEDMALKNQGIFLLVDDVTFEKQQGGRGMLRIGLNDASKHGIVNGGHTFAAIRDCIEGADDETFETLTRAFVRLHILQGIPEKKVAEIAEGLNRSKQVDDPSLANLREDFERIKEVMRGKPGENEIAYHQGADGDIYISEVLVYLSLFNCERYSDDRHPYNLYNQHSLGLKYFEQDLAASPSPAELLIPQTPEILALSDRIRHAIPKAARKVGFEFGRMKTKKGRAGGEKHKGVLLPFTGQRIDYHIPNGWLFPMLAAFRANVRWDLSSQTFQWKIPIDKLLEVVIEDLVKVCVSEHRDNGLRPERVGKRESAYRQCYDKILLYLARSGNL